MLIRDNPNVSVADIGAYVRYVPVEIVNLTTKEIKAINAVSAIGWRKAR